MMIEIETSHFDGIVCVCLKDALETVHWSIANNIIDPDDIKENKKLIKAIERVLEYFGEDL